MATGPSTRCAGCGRFIRRRADGHDDWDAEELAYRVEYEEHECDLDWQPTAAWSPRNGEQDAWLATVERPGRG